MSRKTREDRRIAIVGAGAAGLACAHYLRRKGYSQVSLFEQRSCVGGKCLTQHIGGRSYERGALVVGRPYHHVRELIEAAGLATRAFPPIMTVDSRQPRLIRPAEDAYADISLSAKSRLLGAYLRYCGRLSWAGYRHGLEQTALARESMAGWLRQRGHKDMQAVLAPYYVGWGYGYLERIPALYVFKLLDFYYRALTARYLQPGRNHSMGYIPEGYQRLWEIIAKPFEVLLGVNISCVRRARRVIVEWENHHREFDDLILACALGPAPPFLDAGARERALMAKIRTLDFFSVTAAVDGLPDAPLVFVRNHLTPAKAGHMVSWYRRWPDSNIVVFYTIADKGHTADRIIDMMAKDLAVSGFGVKNILTCDHWQYFPHVATEDLTAGFYRDFEALQGTRRTWYTGELLAFPTVEHVVAYSKHLVDTHF